ncbi:hypothetical protein N658DRAFT_487965 [Parathielavia hyrcaniae]|uniref:NUDE domain-containing protein n=1 Tax=Parathielavia hyrcaniae TaxID=113614 RepID=A0AAN6SYY5_9PEZI|nr:hypothetical protein N658DRAFT_487965 [Parathielavia hyrcaniae]
MSEPPSSPPREGASIQDALAWYKSQYEVLESELSEFQASSKELEAELEKDLEAADKRERALRQKAEDCKYEVEEWKKKYKEAKTEANAAQNILEKEITSLRDTNRTLQLKLRDIEVANDDFERQARTTTSSLEDLESKYNVAIERAVMLEEEIKIGEQERETLRVETQRLREELADLKIEAEILQDKIKKQESRHLSSISTDVSSIPGSPSFCNSPHSTASSPMIMTPPDLKLLSTEASDIHDPPSPPMSDASMPLPRLGGLKTPIPQRKSRLPSAENSITPKPRAFTASTSSSRGTRVVTNSGSGAMRTPAHRSSAARSARPPANRIPPSNSLTHIRTLTAQMQRLEARVQSARSKLPGPASTPPRSSPRGTNTVVPSTVTIRSRKRGAGSTASSSAASLAGSETTPSQSRHAPTDSRSSIASGANKHVPRLSTSGVSRLSFGPLPNRIPTGSNINNTPSSAHNTDPDYSRPSSRASASSYARPASRTESHRDASSIMPPPRPMSRASLSGTRTPLGRPRSSLGMHGGSHGHGHTGSVSYSTAEADEFAISMDGVGELRTASRRGTYSRLELEAAAAKATSGGGGVPPLPTTTTGVHSGIPVPSSRRQSGGTTGRRISGASTSVRVLEDLGETY